jgi:hypothetical protein
MKYPLGNLLAAAALLFSCDAAALQSTRPAVSQDPAQIVSFIFKVFGGKDAIVQAIARETASDPALRDIIQKALPSFDIDELASRFSRPLSQIMAPGEIEQCVTFIHSTNGAAVLGAGLKAPTPSELPRYLDLMTPQEQSAAADFFTSTCFKKTTGFMTSQAANDISNSYGKELMCRYARRTSANMLRELKGRGACQSF